MKINFYPKLAWDGIRKNKRLYFPYILTGCLMVMMYYILSFLSESPSLDSMQGGSVLKTVLPLGCVIIAIFSVLFLFYTNSFLIKQRYREFGLYNILGMDKKNICKIMVWETFFTAAAAIVIGILSGIIFSKFAELVLLNLLKMNVTFDFSIGIKSLYQTTLIFALIYLLLLFNSLIRVARSKPLELMQSSRAGEKVPKRTWIFAVIGVILLALAYYLAVSIKEPLTALIWFFAAVILVIIGTYLLLISGSVVFCKLLQKNKKYYYKANHFVSVSSMIYRMKRNGAGLASICVLLTMVLVMISSTSCLYFGAEDSIKTRYPNDVEVSVLYRNISGISDENNSFLTNEVKKRSGNHKNFNVSRSCEIPGLFTEKGITIDVDNAKGFTFSSYDNVGYIYVLSVDDYNRKMKKNETLADDECMIYSERLKISWESFEVEYGNTYNVKKRLDKFEEDGEALAMTAPVVYMVVNDIEKFTRPIRNIEIEDGEYLTYSWKCGFDTDTKKAEKSAADEIYEFLENLPGKDSGVFAIGISSCEAQRESFYDMYGSLFFLGIMLSIVFIIAAVLIIYYKQISEGYEDYSRFDIMKKVGMTKRDIRKSINSQMLTVFFLPLILAGVHLSFAFPFISKILRMFAFDNTALSISVNVICFAVFGALYALVYKITSGIYYSIVSGRKNI